MKNNKSYNLKVSPGAKSSRFLVDLKKDLPAEEIKPVKISRSEVFEQKIEKLAEVDYG